MDLPSIQKRADAATEGPWFIENHGIMTPSRDYTVVIFGEDETGQDSADAEFIACARTDIPELLDKVTHAEELVDEVTDITDWLMRYCCSNQGRVYGRRLEKLLAAYRGESYDGGNRRSASDSDRAQAADWRERLRPTT